MQEIRIALRGQAVVLMGKNTMMRKAIRGHLETNPDLERLMPHIKQNVGFVFTKMELLHVRDLLLSNKVKAPAKAGALAPVDVVVPAQNTGMGPEKTSFFQALAIPTKITKAWKKLVFSGPIPVFWAGTTTSTGARAPALAGAFTLLERRRSRTWSSSILVKTKPTFCLMWGIRRSRSGLVSRWPRIAFLIMVFLPMRTTA